MTLRSFIKDPASALTHFTGFLAGIGGLITLIVLTWGDTPKLTVMTIYGVSLVCLYGASSLYHWVKARPRVEAVLRRLDHVAIYFLIAGTATPVYYYGLQGAWRTAMLASVWALAALGAFLKIWFINAPRYVSTAFYLTLGWISVIPFLQLIHNLPLGAIILITVGGVMYTIGAAIYATKCFDFFPNKFGFHEVFHLFVLAGSAVHFSLMVAYIVPMP